MTKLLASVTNSQEALWALEAGVDIIDLKNPAEGALGALPLSIISEIVASVAGRAQISATIGDLPMQPDLIASMVAMVAETGVDIVKVGFFPSSNHLACIHALKPLTSRGLKMVAVLFADQDPDFKLLTALADAEFFGVMLDTAHKNGTSLMYHQPAEILSAFVINANLYGLESGLAGSLRFEHVELLKNINPGYMGFRGALCDHFERSAAINKSKVFELKRMLHKNNKHEDSLACS